MRIPDIATQNCSIAHAIGVVGDTWTLMVVRELFLGTRRFDELQLATGISPHLLSVRLRELVADGIVERTEYRAGRYEHFLTKKGTDLWPVMFALLDWADRWGEWPQGRPVHVRHTECGKLTKLKLRCSCCDAPINHANARFEGSPGAMAERRARMEKAPVAGTKPARAKRVSTAKRATRSARS